MHSTEGGPGVMPGPGGSALAGCLVRGMPAPRGCLVRGVLCPRGVPGPGGYGIPACTEADPPVDRVLDTRY